MPGFFPQPPINLIFPSGRTMRVPLRDPGALRCRAFTTTAEFLGGHVV
jgi:hypothetical protein